MGDEDHGVALFVQLLKHPQHLPAGMGVQRARRLVGQDDRRVAGQGAGDGHTLLLAAGELVGLVPELAAQAHPLQRCDGAVARRCAAAHAGVDEGDFHVFQQGQLGQQIVLLEDEAQLLVPDGRQLHGGSSCRRRWPSRQYWPSVGTSRQPMMFMQVDLPEPDWPTMATNSPGLSIWKDVVCRFDEGVAHLVVFADRVELDQGAHSIRLPASAARHHRLRDSPLGKPSAVAAGPEAEVDRRRWCRPPRRPLFTSM